MRKFFYIFVYMMALILPTLTYAANDYKFAPTASQQAIHDLMEYFDANLK